MIESIVFVVVLFGCIFLFPVEYTMWTSLFMMYIWLVVDIYQNKNVMMTIICAVLSTCVSIAYFGFGMTFILPYIGPMFYSLITIVAISNFIAGYWIFSKEKPDSRYWDSKVYRIQQLLVIIFQLLAIALSLAYMLTFISVAMILVSLLSDFYCQYIAKSIQKVFKLKSDIL